VLRVKIPELDGIRGMAILLVLLHHFEPPPGVPKVIGAATYLGWSGVDLFFVLSGFLITGILLDTKTSQNYFSSFYIRRALRIFPLYLLCVFAYFRLAPNPTEPWFWSHLSNWKSAFGTDIPILSHFWSLAIEEQFYLVWPLVVFLIPARALPGVAMTVALSSLGLRVAFAHHAFHNNFLYRLTPFRIEPLALGALAAWIARDPSAFEIAKRSARWIAVAAAVLLLAVFAIGRTNRPFHAPIATYGFTAFAWLYASIVFTAGTRSVPLLRNALLRSFGKYSYAIYVFHVPIAQIYNPEVNRVAQSLNAPVRTAFWIATTAAGIAISYAVALLSWNLIEKRFLALKDRFAPDKVQPPKRSSFHGSPRIWYPPRSQNPG
jgi:peptidoglycan/LPS O-acetylase OafA/YrhL